MKINRHNYEAYLLDQIEGRLSKQQAALLKTFVDNNPALGKWEQLIAALPVLEAENQNFPHKDLLLNIPDTCFDPEEAIIARLEGIATTGEMVRLQTYLDDNPEAKNDLNRYALAYLKPDESIVFPGKKSLLRPLPFISSRQLRTLSVAAAIALLFGWGWWFMSVDRLTQPENPRIALADNKADNRTQSGTEVIEGVKDKETVKSEKPAPPEKQLHKSGKGDKKTGKPAGQQSPAARQAPLPPMPNGNGVIQLNLSMYETQFMYYEPSLAERLALASVLEQMPEFAPQRHRNAPERVANNLFGKALARLQGPATTSKESAGFSLWNLASSGVSAYNFLTDKDVHLIKATGENGQTAVFLDSDNFSFDRKKVGE